MDRAPFIMTNRVGSFVMLEVALEHWCHLPGCRVANTRFMHISTDKVFGSLGRKGVFRVDTLYPVLKAGSDHLVRASR